MVEQREKASRSGKFSKTIGIIILAILVIAMFACKQEQSSSITPNEPTSKGSLGADTEAKPQSQSDVPAETSAVSAKPVATEAKLPRLIDLGADKCIPCKLMAPILDELKAEYAGRLQVDFIDVWKNPQAGKDYGIRLIPTQIFYDADGKEFHRHQGFIAKDDILSVFKDNGVEISDIPK